MANFAKEVNPSPDIKVVKLVSYDKLFHHQHIFATMCSRVTTAIAFSRQTLLHTRAHLVFRISRSRSRPRLNLKVSITHKSVYAMISNMFLKSVKNVHLGSSNLWQNVRV